MLRNVCGKKQRRIQTKTSTVSMRQVGLSYSAGDWLLLICSITLVSVDAGCGHVMLYHCVLPLLYKLSVGVTVTL